LSEADVEIFVAGLKEDGWPDDLAELIGADHRERVTRTYALTIKDAATFLGVTRYAIGKLVDAGRLRRFTIRPRYHGAKSAVRLRADDVADLE
jgi:hypothetical protein